MDKFDSLSLFLYDWAFTGILAVILKTLHSYILHLYVYCTPSIKVNTQAT